MPEKAKLDHKPAYTFGVKVTHEKRSDTPGTMLYRHTESRPGLQLGQIGRYVPKNDIVDSHS